MPRRGPFPTKFVLELALYSKVSPRFVGFAPAAALLAIWLCAALPAGLEAGVFHSRDEALAIAFPDAEEIHPLDFYLTPEQRSEIEQRAQTKVESNLVTVYVGTRGGQRRGYALIDTHVVRTLPETLLVVLSPRGEVRGVHLLAFYEPQEYAPPAPWFEQFRRWKARPESGHQNEVAAIAGSTLTSRAVQAAVRRALAIYEVLLLPTHSAQG